MSKLAFDHPDTAAPKDLVVKGLSHPQMLDTVDVRTLCEKLLQDLFDLDEQAGIIKVLEAAAYL